MSDRLQGALWALVVVWLLPGEASAHLVSTRFGELYSGLLHPLTTLVHVVPWVGLGLLGGLQETSVARQGSWVLPASVVLGALFGFFLPGVAAVDYLNAASFVVFGLLAALAAPLGERGFASLAAVFGVTHGYANANLDLSSYEQGLYLFGLGLAAYGLITLVTAGAQLASSRTRWGRVALRAGGSWIVAIGLIFTVFSLSSSTGST